MRVGPWILVAALGCGRRDEAPDEGGMPDRTWRRHAVPECGFSVELMGAVDRTVSDGPELSGGRRIMVANVVGSESTAIVYCELYPPDMVLPGVDGMLAGSLRHVKANLEGLGGGIASVDQRATTVRSFPAMRYRVTLGNGMAQDGVIIHAGRQMHSMSVVRAAEDHLDRIVASYERR